MGKQDIVINDALLKIKIDPESFVITIKQKRRDQVF
jgi:urease alpha subunit